MDVNDGYLNIGWLLLRVALAAPVVLMAWLIRRGIRRGGLPGRPPDQS